LLSSLPNCFMHRLWDFFVIIIRSWEAYRTEIVCGSNTTTITAKHACK
jgi:hypothetical protein